MTRYDRFSPVLTRFFTKRFGTDAQVSLDRVESAPFSALMNRGSAANFPARIGIQTVEIPFFLSLADELTSILLDAALGDTAPEPDPFFGELTRLDRRLLEEIYNRLADSIARFWREEYVLLPARILPIPDWTVPVWGDSDRNSEGFRLDDETDFFILTWMVRICQREFSLELYLPSLLMPVLSDAEPAALSSELRILAGRIPFTPETASLLYPGEVLLTGIPAGALFDAVCDGKILFQVRPGEYRGEAAVEIVPPQK